MVPDHVTVSTCAPVPETGIVKARLRAAGMAAFSHAA
jgi:hypothetical protein